MPCYPFSTWIGGYVFPVGVHTGLIAAGGENAQLLLLVDLFINRLSVFLKGQCCNSDFSFISFNTQM